MAPQWKPLCKIAIADLKDIWVLLKMILWNKHLQVYCRLTLLPIQNSITGILQ